VIFLSIVAVAGSASSWEEIELFGKTHLNVLREYYPFEKGIPSDNTIRRVFEILDPEGFNVILREYFSVELSSQDIAIDGKSLRGSKHAGKRALHFLNVYAAGSGITLFGKAIPEKDNEITAIPEAIDALDIRGSTVTIDAMGCQKSIAKQIIDKGADYILGLKGNHTTLHNEVRAAFESNAESFFDMEKVVSSCRGHGREEARECRVIRDLSKIPSSKNWDGIKAVIEIQKKTTSKGKITESTNYYISSSTQNAEHIAQSIRNHWKIESMHWVLDVVFKEDASSMRKGNIPANMAITRRFVFNILEQLKKDEMDPKSKSALSRKSKPMLMNIIGWSDDYLHKFIQKLMKGS
jgi:predicted transposase YbfD/YdcC